MKYFLLQTIDRGVMILEGDVCTRYGNRLLLETIGKPDVWIDQVALWEEYSTMHTAIDARTEVLTGNEC